MPSEPNGAPLTIAAYGFVSQQAGSVASADSVILEHLLKRGHRVDFYAFEGFLDPEELKGHPNYRYIPVASRAARAGWSVVDRVPKRLRGPLALGYSLAVNPVQESAVAAEVGREHRKRPYDALVALGLLAPFRVAGLPCVSWPQGPPESEWRSLHELYQGPLRPYFGPGQYAALGALYRYKMRLSRRQLAHSDRIVCGSRWSADEWERFGVPARAVLPIPYPYDLEMFRPGPRPEDGGGRPFRFLWLGRIVPRKRLDLMLDAFRRLRAERPDVELILIGQFSYVRRLRRLLDESADVGGVDYRPSIDRADVPALFHRVDAVVQPSENENLGSAVLEGIACGVPAVVGPTNGTKDYLGASSVVFDAYTPEALKDALIRTIEAVRGDRARVAAEARAAAERYLGADTVVGSLEGVIREAAAAGAGGLAVAPSAGLEKPPGPGR